jgi:predicted Abi (CAAX) family protease
VNKYVSKGGMLAYAPELHEIMRYSKMIEQYLQKFEKCPINKQEQQLIRIKDSSLTMFKPRVVVQKNDEDELLPRKRCLNSKLKIE